jgi:iron complex transport system permease protein
MTRNYTKLTLCIAALIVAGLMSMSFGQVSLTFADFINAIVNPNDNPHSVIIFELRMPRILLGMLVGASLGLAGAALQGVLRNPLADPGVIGVSASAVWSLYIPLFAMGFALLATLLLLLVASRDSSVLMLILVGIGISSLATAFISLVMNIADSPMTMRDMIMWMLGSLENRTTTDLYLAVPFVLFVWALMIGVGQGLDALSLGEDTAQSMGIDLLKLKLRIVIGTAISVGAAVSVCGSIGFVGLVVPHIVRGLITKDPSGILIPSAFIGALLLTISDTLTRLPITDTPLRLGVVTAIIGAPCFLYIVFKTRKEMR